MLQKNRDEGRILKRRIFRKRKGFDFPRECYMKKGGRFWIKYIEYLFPLVKDCWKKSGKYFLSLF